MKRIVYAMTKVLALTFAFGVFVAFAAIGQTTTATITGRVADQQGKVIAGTTAAPIGGKICRSTNLLQTAQDRKFKFRDDSSWIVGDNLKYDVHYAYANLGSVNGGRFCKCCTPQGGQIVCVTCPCVD